jgi:hypothetical protein
MTAYEKSSSASWRYGFWLTLSGSGASRLGSLRLLCRRLRASLLTDRRPGSESGGPGRRLPGATGSHRAAPRRARSQRRIGGLSGPRDSPCATRRAHQDRGLREASVRALRQDDPADCRGDCGQPHAVGDQFARRQSRPHRDVSAAGAELTCNISAIVCAPPNQMYRRAWTTPIARPTSASSQYGTESHQARWSHCSER